MSEVKKCYKCQKTMSIEEFYRHNKRKDGRQSICKECSNKRRISYYKENRERENLVRIKHKKEMKDWFHGIKCGLSCEKCGFSHPAALQFHHKKNKNFHISNAVTGTYSKKRILEEIKRCIVLCANCHAILHYETNTRGKVFEV